MFGGDDEDGDFLSPTGGAKLASLFGLDKETSQGNESFQYTAPKQPRKSSNPANQKPAPTPSAPAVLFVSAVQAFRYINGQYVKQGKLGAAVLGNHSTKEYKLLLYLSQQKQVAAAKIHMGFIFTVQPNNYCTFYDDQRQNWSLMFESEKNALDFCKEVCLAKANSSSSLNSVVAQDLILGEGQAVETGDSLEVVYTGWLLQNHAIGQIFDSNQNKDKLLRLKIGAGKVIKGWEEGMLGMKKGGRRLIIIPPSLAYGSKEIPNQVPANSTLIFEAELRRVKYSKDSGSDQASASSRDSAAPSPAPSVENLISEAPVPTTASGPGRPGEPPLRAKSNSLNEQFANPDATKAKLISRMAKMGQPMLPFLTGAANHPESSDSEFEDTSGNRGMDGLMASSAMHIPANAPPSAHVHPHPHTAPTSALLPVMASVCSQSGLPGMNHAFQPQMQPVPQAYPAQTVPYMGSGDVTSFLMTEARQHNTEIRLAVGKVSDKVDQLATKIDDLQRQGNNSLSMSSMSMETSMIMHSVQRIVQENECLKKEVFEKSSRIEEQNHKIGDLINQNQRYMEQSHLLLEQRNDSLKSSCEQNQARLLQAEQDKHALSVDIGYGQVHLTEELASSTARVSQLQLEASGLQQKVLELQGKLGCALEDSESHCKRIVSLETQLQDVQEGAEKVQTQYRTERQRRKEMEQKVNIMEEELQDLKSDKESLEWTLSERKKKWQAERQHWEEEMKELRKNSQQELDNLRTRLRQTRTSNDNAASEQLSQLQVELEEEWKGKCEQTLALAKEEHSRELHGLTEQRDALQDKLTQLQEKFMVLKQSRNSEEQNSLHLSKQSEELQALQEKYTALEKQGAAVRQKLEKQVEELERKVEEQGSSGDTEAEVKRVMNGVFHSLRAEFDLSESYSGQAVLAVIVTTIKNVTLQLLSGIDKASPRPNNKEDRAEEVKEEEREPVKQGEKKPDQTVHANGQQEATQEEEEEEEEEKRVEDANSGQTDEAQMIQEVPAEEETAPESKALTPMEDPEASDPHKDVSREPLPQEPETVAVESVVAQKQEQQSASDSCMEKKDSNKLSDKHKDELPEESSVSKDGQERNATVTSVENVERVEDRGNVGETNSVSQKAFGPPANPPPPPDVLQNMPAEDTRRVVKDNGEEPFFPPSTPSKAPSARTEEEDEDEMSLKGRPPPTPLFGDEEDDEDLDWLN
ncbi:FK506-binding protein 15 isoform 1-T1 [Menidia menidia]